MMIKLNKSVNLFVLMLSMTVMLAFIPLQVDARKGNRDGGGKARSSVNRSNNRNSNSNKNKNVNVNKNINVDVDVNHRRRGYHPIATGVAIGVTAAIIGSVIYTLPTGCTTIITNGISYRQCGSTWYQPQYSGNNVSYIVVNTP